MMACKVIHHKQVKETSRSEIPKAEALPAGLSPADQMMTQLREALIVTARTRAVAERSSPCTRLGTSKEATRFSKSFRRTTRRPMKAVRCRGLDLKAPSLFRRTSQT